MQPKQPNKLNKLYACAVIKKSREINKYFYIARTYNKFNLFKHPHTMANQYIRTLWRVWAALIEAGATLEQLATGATLVRTAHELHMVTDLADLSRMALSRLLHRADPPGGGYK